MDTSIPGGNIPAGGGTTPGTFGNGEKPLTINTALSGDGYSSEIANSAKMPPPETPADGGQPTVEKVS